MERTKQKIEEDIKEWILSFERLARKPVVVSLLIQDGNIEFVNCSDRNRVLDVDDDEADDEADSPRQSLNELAEERTRSARLSFKDYIG